MHVVIDVFIHLSCWRDVSQFMLGDVCIWPIIFCLFGPPLGLVLWIFGSLFFGCFLSFLRRVFSFGEVTGVGCSALYIV